MKNFKHLSGFFLLCCICGALVFELHELCHYGMGKALGLDVAFRVSHIENSTENARVFQIFLYNLAGPAGTFFFAIISCFFLLNESRYKLFFSAFALANGWLRFWATFRAIKGEQSWQDEYQIAALIGLDGTWVSAFSMSLAIGILLVALYLSKPLKAAKFPIMIIGVMAGAGFVNILAQYLFYNAI